MYRITETTALGAAYLAGLATGYWKLAEIQKKWQIDAEYITNMSHEDRKKLYTDWKKALKASIKFAK